MTLEAITHEHLAPLRHGFFTRRGGASSGVFAGLNCGRGSSDQTEVVEINRTRVAETMGTAVDALVSVNQVHSADVVVIDAVPGTPLPRADAMVTTQPGLVLGVLTADCQPVLFADLENKVIGAAHAGWKGALHGVLEATVDTMVTLGARRAAIVATIGPSLSQLNYEVGPDFFDTFVGADPENARFFVKGNGDRLQFDLPGFGLMRLRRAGIGAAAWTHHCTYADPDRFFSYRRSVHLRQADYGRLISTIRL